jgi:hypothetical protein
MKATKTLELAMLTTFAITRTKTCEITMLTIGGLRCDYFEKSKNAKYEKSFCDERSLNQTKNVSANGKNSPEILQL